MRTFWFTLVTDLVNAVVRAVLLLLLGKEEAEKAYKPVMKALIVLSIVVVICLVCGAFYRVLRN